MAQPVNPEPKHACSNEWCEQPNPMTHWPLPHKKAVRKAAIRGPTHRIQGPKKKVEAPMQIEWQEMQPVTSLRVQSSAAAATTPKQVVKGPYHILEAVKEPRGTITQIKGGMIANRVIASSAITAFLGNMTGQVLRSLSRILL